MILGADMFKKMMVFFLAAFMVIAHSGMDVMAATKNAKKKKNRTSYVHSKSKNKKNKKKFGKARRYKRTGNGPDLRALTTESTNTEFTATPDNGVNAVETKPGL